MLRPGRRPAGDLSSAETSPDQGKDKLPRTDQRYSMPCPQATCSHPIGATLCVPCARTPSSPSLMLHVNGAENAVISIIHGMRNLRPRGQGQEPGFGSKQSLSKTHNSFLVHCVFSLTSQLLGPQHGRAGFTSRAPQVHAMSLFVSVVSLPHSLD